MATTAIWKVESRLDHVIDYANDPQKTIYEGINLSIFDSLHDVIDYAQNADKTEKMFYVSGINCIPENAYEDMMITKREYNKIDGIKAFHAYQSFKGHEVSPELAHQIGLKLAEEMWGDKYEVLVATHLNTENYHNHFVINSVSFKDGKKYRDTRHNYAMLRSISDSLCQEYGLNVLEEKPTRKKINYSNYCKSYIKNSPYYQTAKVDIDRAIGMALSYKDFENLLRKMDYQIIYRGKNIMSVRREPYKKNIRVERSFGSEYSIERIEERIQNSHEIRVPFIRSLGIKKYISNVPKYNVKKHKGLYGLFLYYCYLFGVFEKKATYTKLSPKMKGELKKMKSISKQAILLYDNKIETSKDFYIFKNEITTKIDGLILKRQKLWGNYHNSVNPAEKENIRSIIDVVNFKIKEERQNLKLCESIEARATEIETNVKDLENEIRKEERKNEFIK